MLHHKEHIMVFEWVAVEVLEDERGRITRTVVDEGKLDAPNRDTAILRIGAHFGLSIEDNWEILIRPFLSELVPASSLNVFGTQTYGRGGAVEWTPNNNV
jgi:hypothetical protein